MNIDTRRAFRLALAPIASAVLMTACAPYETYPPVYGSTAPIGAPGAPVTLSTFDRLDTNRDGFLSRGEIEPLGVRSQTVSNESATAAFHRYDVNRDGFLSRTEAEAMLGIPGWSFDASDQNRDGFLSLTEALPHLRWLEARGTAGYPSFEALDVDRDGFLSRAEAQPLISSARWDNGRWVMAAPVAAPLSFDALDRNRDGFLSRDEAMPAIGARAFERYDTNRDGFLSRAEVDMMPRGAVGATYGTHGGTIYNPR